MAFIKVFRLHGHSRTPFVLTLWARGPLVACPSRWQPRRPLLREAGIFLHF